MKKESIKYINVKAARRARRVRARIRGTAVRPRMSVHLSHKHLLVQCIDDTLGRTIFAASDAILGVKATRITVALAQELGKKAGELARSKGISAVVFDRGSRAYHGRVKAFAEGIREGGIQF